MIHQTVVAKFFIQVKYFACTTSRNGLGPWLGWNFLWCECASTSPHYIIV